MAGTFAGALEARRIEFEPEALEVEAEGEIFDRDGVLVIERITVRYRLSGIAPDRREDVERVHGVHARACPVARSLEGGIEVRTELELA
ncbi:MAG: OsmC family protein [Thermoleophilaceae bacterium]|nr:OsmC family protein [Thermoleophilaceae bacterium]